MSAIVALKGRFAIRNTWILETRCHASRPTSVAFFVLSKRHKCGMAQRIVSGPFHKFKSAHKHRLYPWTIFRLWQPQLIQLLAMQYPDAQTIHLVMDNLNIHRRKSLTDLLDEEVGGQVWNRFTVHYTPTHGSWLNQAEIEIGLFSRQYLGTRRIPDLKVLRKKVQAWNRIINRRKTRITGRSIAKRQDGRWGTKGS